MSLRDPKWEKKFLKLALLERREKSLAIAEELSEIMNPINLSAMLDEFLYETSHAVHHHTDSYTHDNGFDKIVLFQDPVTRMKMRLHLWHPVDLINGGVRSRQNIHNHRWDFSSGILAGFVENHSYEFSKDKTIGESFFHYRYFARGSKEHYTLERVGNAQLVGLANTKLSSGNIYSIEAEMLHCVDVPGDQFVATLIITHENIGWVTNDLLSVRELDLEQKMFPSPAMSCQQIVDKVVILRENIGV